jgi:hypothetical protein
MMNDRGDSSGVRSGGILAYAGTAGTAARQSKSVVEAGERCRCQSVIRLGESLVLACTPALVSLSPYLTL